MKPWMRRLKVSDAAVASRTTSSIDCACIPRSRKADSRRSAARSGLTPGAVWK
jgi:hypothetical protein